MAVNLFVIPKQAKCTQGALKRIYIAKYAKHLRLEIEVEGMKLISMPTTNFYKIDMKGDYTQSQNTQNGADYFDQNITVKLNEFYNKLDANVLNKTEFRVLAETNNNTYLMFGLYNGMRSKLSNNSGGSKQDFNGLELAFQGKEIEMAYYVADPLTTGIILSPNKGDFNNDFNNDFLI